MRCVRSSRNRKAGIACFCREPPGDLGPREGFVGDTQVADRNGRQVGHAALSTLATLSPPGTEYRYAGSVISGTAIGTWRHEPLSEPAKRPAGIGTGSSSWSTCRIDSIFPRSSRLQLSESIGSPRKPLLRAAHDEPRVRDARAQVEQRTRQLTRLNNLVPGRSYPLTLRLGFLGDAIWVFVPASCIRCSRSSCGSVLRLIPCSWTTLTNDWQPGYIPPASTYGHEIYQEVIAATAPGCLETLIEAISRRLTNLLAERGS